MVFENILDAIGGTPIVKLQRMPEADSAEILVKVEALNVGGSIKTRTAYNMLDYLRADKRQPGNRHCSGGRRLWIPGRDCHARLGE